jgi:anti-sigma regulatory factor (Ser/Thr protein kinase)
MHNLHQQGYDKINLDFTGVTYAFAAEMLPFTTACRAKMVSGVELLLELPRDPALSRLFTNCNWAHIIDPRSFERSNFQPHNHLPALTYGDSDTHFEQVDRVMELLIRQLGFTRDQLAPLEWAINEITDNVLNHAQSPIGGMLQVSVSKQKNVLEFIVCDAGQSIPATLREVHKKITSDSDALDKAIREGVTRNTSTNMGNGLFGSYRIAQLSKGHFSIYSRHALLDYSHKRGLHISRQKVPFPGATVVCGIKLDNPKVLEEALAFKGEVHKPVYTYLDRMVEPEEIILSLKTESHSFGSREAGRGIKNKILALANSGSSKLIVDLSDVALISSSYADEVFGKVFVELGPMAFMSKIQVIGSNQVVKQLIDRAISQRVALLGSSKDQ